MRTICKDVFKYEELSDKAKEKARDWYREGNNYFDDMDSKSTFKAFEDSLPIKITDYSYGEEASRSYFRFTVTDENVEDLKGLRLRTWLVNNFWNKLETGKFTYSGAVSADMKSYHSKMTTEVSCPVTSMCFDEDIIKPIRDFIFKYNLRRDDSMSFKDLVEECFESFIQAVANDIEYQTSDEQVEEAIIANEYEFDIDGKRA